MKRTALVAACAALVATLAATNSTAADTTRVIVAFKPGTAAQMRGVVSMARGSVDLEIVGMNAMAVTVPSAALAGLSRNPHVEYVEEDAKRYPFALATPSTGAPYASGQLVPYGIGMVQADLLAASANAANRKICIIDSGYNLGHTDLPGASDVSGDNDSGTGDWNTDENSHGTHVAGTIAALNNSTGVVGVAPGVKLHIIKVFGADGWAYSSTLAAAANKCKDAGANVISMSLGGSVSNRTEQRAFDALYAANILSIAAAGNGGNTRTSYPAGYASVMSVAAVDEFRALASFSQRNKDVEISGPGVGVLSTVPMGTGLMATLAVGGTAYAPIGMDGSPATSASAPLADFGLGGSAVAGSMNGKVCLVQRGTYDFATKVSNCQASGGVGAVIYNNVQGSFSGTLGGVSTSIPSMTVSDTEGAALRNQFNLTANAAVGVANHAYFDGTSMATPHVSAVAALVWSHNTSCSASQIRNTLNKSALNLGTAGRDTSFGFGLVQAKAAVDRLASGCNN